MSDLSTLQSLLPAFQGVQEVIVQKQNVDDIITEVVTAHKLFEPDYDKISGEYLQGPLYERLFEFCQSSLPYVAESEKRQSSRSPAAILVMAKVPGVDCKHYAGWIAGIIGGVERLTGTPIPWKYRFVSYDKKDPEPKHVFVVIEQDGGDIWIDPTPIIDPVWGTRYERLFNDRMMVGTYYVDQKIKKMALTRIRGIGTNYIVDEQGCLGAARLGDTITDVLNAYDQVESNTSGGGTSTPASGGSGTGGTSNTLIKAGDAVIDTALAGLSVALKVVASVLPNGALKDFITGFTSHPIETVLTFIKGRTYTSGDYKLGEIFMRNILGMTNITTWEQVPDQYCPMAWMFFSAAVGVRIRTFDDLDTLTGTGPTPPSERGQAYLNREPTETSDISLAAATRAATIFGDTAVSQFNMWNHHDTKWPLTIFSTIPYIYPVPGVVQNTNFGGIHPILGTHFTNGYPDTYTGIRNLSQTNQTVQSSTSSVPGTIPGTVAPSITQPNTLSTGKAVGIALVSGAVLTAIFGASQPVKKPTAGHQVTGLTPQTKTALIVVSAVVAAVGGYLLWKAYSPAGQKAALLAFIANDPNSDASSKAGFTAAVNQMTDAEITDVYNFIETYAIPGKPLTDAIDAPLRARIIAISAKYNIFT